VLVFGVACLVATARTLDLWSTRVVTPDLAGEQNVVLDSAGGGWTGLILLSVVQVAFAAALFAAAIAVQPQVRPRRRNLRFLPFWRAAIWGRPRPLSELRRRWPPKRRWLWAVGRFFPWAVMACSLVAALGNVLAYNWPPFRAGWALLVGTPLSQVGVLLAAILLAGAVWAVFEHQCYLGAQPAPPSIVPAGNKRRLLGLGGRA
jgi:hypothetical protein